MDLFTRLATTDQRSPGRACFLLRVRPERLDEYVEEHQHVWDEMREALSRCGWRHYSLFLRPGDGLVVGYFEADDTAAAMAAMAGEEVDARWQASMAPYFQAPDGGTPELLHQYFHLA
ncbi:MAG: L-rhamnose mutarotase [Propionibacterium sp.]|nr:L-rhamnose mutarotase [Propionibacterium sp.]